jgi:hypothetical protein
MTNEQPSDGPVEKPRPRNEPRTKAGRALDRDIFEWSGLERAWTRAIMEVEAEAAHPATEGLDATRLVAELGKARDALMELLLAAQDMDDGITEHGWAIQKARAVLGLSPEGQEK